MSIETTVEGDVKVAKSWFLLHERLIITILVMASVLFIGNKILDHEAVKDKTIADQTALVLQQQQTQNKELATQVSQLTSQYNVLSTQLTAQNAQLATAVANRTVVLQQQQVKDQALPLPDLGNRWAQLVKLPAIDLTANPQGLEVSPDVAVATVDQLEEVPVLTQDVADEKQTDDNLTKELGSATNLNEALTNQVANLSATIIDQTKAFTAEVTSLKAQARKSKLHWFGIGFIVGYISGLVTHFF